MRTAASRLHSAGTIHALEAVENVEGCENAKPVSGSQGGVRCRVEVDVAGYLAKRRQNLKKMAERMAEKCKRVGKPMTIGQMNAYDRRIVHITLKDDEEVRTQSMGDGYLRKLVIFPKKGSISSAISAELKTLPRRKKYSKTRWMILILKK